MTPAEISETLQRASEIRQRAVDIVGGAPYWKFIAEPEFVRLRINGEEAEISWLDDESEYGEVYIVTRSASFPASLLPLTDDQFKAWQDREKVKYNSRACVNCGEPVTRDHYKNGVWVGDWCSDECEERFAAMTQRGDQPRG